MWFDYNGNTVQAKNYSEAVKIVEQLEEYEKKHKGGYVCVVCHQTPVDALAGYDTCDACLKRI